MLLALINDESKSINSRLDIVQGQYERKLRGKFDREIECLTMVIRETVGEADTVQPKAYILPGGERGPPKMLLGAYLDILGSDWLHHNIVGAAHAATKKCSI